MVRVPSPCESPYDGREHDFPASASQDGTEGAGLETSWHTQAEADGECFVQSQENHDEMGGGCGDLGEYPSDRNLSIPLDPDHHSLDRISEMGEAQGGAE